MEEVTVKNYQQLAMCTCLQGARKEERSQGMETRGKAMKHETYRLKATGCLFYFKVCTDERETVIYFVRSNAKGCVLGSLEIRAGEPMDKISAFIWCDRWVRSLLLSPFCFENGILKLEMETVMKTTEKNNSILGRLGLTKADIKEALKFKPKPKPKIQHRGSVSPVKTPCKCGGTGMLQQWIESDSKCNSKLYAMVFCQECERKTKIYSERTLNESRQEALNEWNIRNRK